MNLDERSKIFKVEILNLCASIKYALRQILPLSLLFTNNAKERTECGLYVSIKKLNID